MNSSVAKVLWHGLFAQLDNAVIVGNGWVEFELPEVGREVDRPPRRYDLAQLLQECYVVPLHIPYVFGPLAVGERRRVDHDQVERFSPLPRPLADKLDGVLPSELMG